MVMISIILRWTIITYYRERTWTWDHGTFHHKPLLMSHCWFMWHLKLQELQICCYKRMPHTYLSIQLYCGEWLEVMNFTEGHVLLLQV